MRSLIYRRYFVFFWIVALIVGCRGDLPPVDKFPATIDATNNTQAANWRGCQTMYWNTAFTTAQTPYTASNLKAIADAFDAYNNGGSSLRLEKVSGSNISSITVTLMPAATFKASQTDGLLTYELKSISYYQINTDKRAVIYINAESKLSNAQLQAVLLHQLSKIVGLPANIVDKASVTLPPDLSNPYQALSNADATALRVKYSSDCPALITANTNPSGLLDGAACGDIKYIIYPNPVVIEDTKLFQVAQKAADLWSNAGTYIKFSATTNIDEAAVEIRFTTKNDFTETQLVDGTDTYSLIPISKLVAATASTKATIFLNQDYKWTENAVLQAIAQQMGYYLGLKKSNDPNSQLYQLYRPAQPLLALGQSDITELKSRYGEFCPLFINIDENNLKINGIGKVFGRCNLTYSITATNSIVLPEWTNASVTGTFSAFNNANFGLKFTPKPSDEKQPTFTVTFANAATVGKNRVAKIEYRDIYGLDAYTIVFNWEITTWTQSRLQSVLTHVLGRVLGLAATNTEKNTVMYSTLKSVNPNLTLSTTESNTLQGLYPGSNCTNLAAAFLPKINTMNVPNCLIRLTAGYYSGALILPSNNNFTNNINTFNGYLQYPRLANYSSIAGNVSLFFGLASKSYTSYLNTIENGFDFNSTKIPYNRISYVTLSSDKFNYNVFLDSQIPQLSSNNAAAYSNLQMYYIGRMLGLEDSDDPTSIMYPYISTVLKSPNALDIQGIKSLSSPPCNYTLSTGWRKAPLSNPAVSSGFSFSINEKGYYGYSNGTYEFDPVRNQTTFKLNAPTGAVNNSSFFSSDTKGYIFGGYQNITYTNGDTTYNYSKDLWEYDPAANRWLKLTELPAPARQSAIGFCINGKIYVGGGFYNTFIGNGRTTTTNLKDFWEYDLSTKQWTQKGNLSSGVSSFTQWQSFVYQGKGYTFNRSLWVYDPASDQWSIKASYTAANGPWGGFFVAGEYAYVALPYALNEMHRYDIRNDRWTRMPDPGIWPPLNVSNYFSLNGKGYLIGNPIGYANLPNEVWEYTPQ